MGFLAPWFLAGLAAVGLPVWLHLLKRHRSTPSAFPSLMFFERHIQSSVKHRRLQYLLLFAVRALLVVTLALAFANPFVRTKAPPGAGAGKLVVLAIDNSFSMRQGGRLERAKSEAIALQARSRPQDRVQAIAFAAQVQMADSIAAIEATDARGAYIEMARAVRSLAQSAGMPVEVHLFSDMQKSGLPPSLNDARLPDGVALVIHPAATGRVENLAVESVEAPARVFESAKPRIAVTVASYGAGAQSRRIAIAVNGRELAATSIEVPASGRATAEFPAIELPYGVNRCEARMSPADAFPDDDHLYFSIERGEPKPALFVHEARETRAPLYFQTALAAMSEPAVRLDVVTPDQAAGMALAHYAFVVLSDVAGMPAALDAALDRYVREGGALLVALGPNAAARGMVPVLRSKVSGTRYSPAEGERFESSDRFAGVRFYQTARPEAGEARVAARLSDSAPLLYEQQASEGRVMVFASTFDNVANDFPLHAAFVPFVQETARDLAGIPKSAATLTTGAYLELRAGERGSAVEVIDPSGRRALSLEESTRAKTLRLERAGFYDVRRPSGRNQVLAVNPDRVESDLDPIPEETLALWRAAAGPAQANASARAAGAAERKRNWGWESLAMALVLALAESALANRHLRVDTEAA